MLTIRGISERCCFKVSYFLQLVEVFQKCVCLYFLWVEILFSSLLVWRASENTRSPGEHLNPFQIRQSYLTICLSAADQAQHLKHQQMQTISTKRWALLWYEALPSWAVRAARLSPQCGLFEFEGGSQPHKHKLRTTFPFLREPVQDWLI